MKQDQFPVLYILMRTDLPSMNAGKAMAQASHASNAFIRKANDSVETNNSVNKWCGETNQGFGTVLVLGVTESQMRTANVIAGQMGFVADIVTDPTYPILVPTELGRAIRADNACVAANNGLNGEADFSNVTAGVTDNYVTIQEDTCSYIFGDKNDPILKAIVGNFKLHP